MSIIHEAYLFDPLAFVLENEPGIRLSLQDRHSGWNQLRSTVLEVFDANLQVRLLADNHGGWDRVGIAESFLNSAVPDQDAIPFCYTLLLYNRLSGPMPPKEMGLGIKWWAYQNALQHAGWDVGDIALVFDGKNFKDLLLGSGVFGDLSTDNLQDLGATWAQISPYSVCGRAGWLDRSDVRRLTNQMQGLVTIKEEHADFPANLECMLKTASDQETGLCIIHSG
jgi:hypothetical protein